MSSALEASRPIPARRGQALTAWGAQAVTPSLIHTPLATLKKGSRSFNFAARALPSSRRMDTALLYAFCRAVDDAADEARSPVTAKAELSHLRDQILGARPAEPLVGALLSVAQRRNIDLRHALSLIEGVESDLGTVALADDEALHRYCYKVAGTVGLMMCGILGVEDPNATAHAVDLGIAMQITNICRDVAEDAARGRVYLPKTRLSQVGISQEGLRRREVDRRALSAVIQALLKEADLYYASGERGLAFIPLRPRLAVLIAARVYRAIGAGLRAQQYDPLRGRVIVSAPRKLAIAARALGTIASRRFYTPPQTHQARLHRHLHGLPGAHLG